MRSYIFITTKGYTFQPESESIEPDIENCQVVSFAQGKDEKQAFENLINDNDYLLETTFDELICLELRHPDYGKHARHFYFTSYRRKGLTNQAGDHYKLIISDIHAGGGAIIDLYYDERTNKVKEAKTLADKTVLSVEFTIDDFDPERYGDEGIEFLKKIRRASFI